VIQLLNITAITPNAVRVIKDSSDEKFPKVVQYENSIYMYGTYTSQTEISAVYYSPVWLYGKEVKVDETGRIHTN
jgi:hypothetical protein